MTCLLRKNIVPFVLPMLLLAAFLGTGCSKKSVENAGSAQDTTVVLANIGDADYLNPVIGTSVTTSEVYGAMYPGLLKGTFDTTAGLLKYEAATPNPAGKSGYSGAPIATSWKISDDHKSVTYTLRNDVKWNDGTPITSADFKFSYKLYGDTSIASVRQQHLAELIGADKGQVDFDKAILTPNDTTLIFSFYKPVSEALALFHTGLTPVPKHIWEKVPVKEFRQSEYNFNPVGCGPFKLEKWTKQQEIVLASNPKCNMPHPGKIQRVVFRVIPDYTVRVGQLQTGAVDVVQNVKPEDLQNLTKTNPNIEVKTVGLRVYDYVGWMNIDQKLYSEKGIVKPHPLFGSRNVRKALTYAIDRQSIIDGFLGKYGVMCNTDISPTLKWAYNDTLKPYLHDQQKAVELLEAEGWKIGPDGIRQKDGKKFSFTLYTNSGNNRRNYASTIIQQNLKEIGIECKIEAQESNVFFENLRTRKLDAFLAGWSIGLEIDPLDVWGSNLEKSRFNNSCYQNKRVDELCNLAKAKLNTTDAAPYWKEYQRILHDDQPYTFLYWMKETSGFNKRIQGEEVNILGALYNMDEWTLNSARTVTP
ncbi:MAG: ABC transporter substrate-binding protein [Chlorobiales bacterium]|jgi:peptide/nickel transport system substrate-binding protein|nr:ABC transporter substrate-binding protein [Chlorobiales bacterium]